ncbi:MAG: 5-fold beta-flower protein [Candidatus Heimdallarchaeota archaeon]
MSRVSITNSSGSTIGYVDGSSILNSSGSTIGRISGSSITNSSGSTIGRFSSPVMVLLETARVQLWDIIEAHLVTFS